MDIYNKFWNAYQFLAENAYLYQEEFYCTVLVIVIMIVVTSLHRKSRREWRRFMRKLGVMKGIKQMNKGEYRDHLKTIQGDAIFDALENLVEAGKLSRHDCTKTLRQISKILNIPGFIATEKLDLTSLTAEEFSTVQSVLRSKKQLKKLIFDNKKVYIPGPEDVMPIDKKLAERAKQLAEDGKMETMKQSLQRKVFGGNLRKTSIV